MFRCHFTQGGQIVMGDHLDVATLEEAISEGQKLLAERSQIQALDGIEIWDGTKLLYKSSDAV